jgi:hypothetical protein
MARTEPTTSEALALQAEACASLGSPLYADLLLRLRADFDTGGLTHELLAHRPERPLRDAVPLRLLGAVHRIVLRGGAPDLAAHYPSAGGDGSPVPLGVFLAAVRDHRAEIDEGLGTQVQTNEVGRAAVLTTGHAVVDRRTGLDRDLLEIGASAGLNLNADRYAYDTGISTAGDPDSPVRFEDVWAAPVDLSGLATVAHRAGCDIAPIDAADPLGRLRLLSFVWPDQHHRFQRLSAALDVAAAHPPEIDQGDAGDWLTERLAARRDGVCTVVQHSIVWQYLSPQTQGVVRDQLAAHGERADAGAPLAWLRMEPSGPVASLHLTLWRGGPPEEILVATAGYHGAAITPVEPG